jgi:3-hydroxyisobutyrate dehydrogenase-like beta-hydroxyacid dehydrogenase
MGSAVGASARCGGSRVLWAGEGRSAATRARAHECGFEEAHTLGALVEASTVILSVCPPHCAIEVARSVAALGFSGIYVDANAVASSTAREIGRAIEQAGAVFVDGAVIGPPPAKRGSTRLYLSGSAAARIAPIFAAGPLEVIVLSGGPGAASALKMAYAAWHKGSIALLLSACALAGAEGVSNALMEEWELSHPELPPMAQAAARTNARKAWRWVGEMHEIAASFEAVGLPRGFHDAAARVYRRLESYKGAPSPLLTDVLSRLITCVNVEPRGY